MRLSIVVVRLTVEREQPRDDVVIDLPGSTKTPGDDAPTRQQSSIKRHSDNSRVTLQVGAMFLVYWAGRTRKGCERHLEGVDQALTSTVGRLHACMQLAIVGRSRLISRQSGGTSIGVSGRLRNGK